MGRERERERERERRKGRREYVSMSIQIYTHECVRVSVRRGGREVSTVHIWLTMATRYHGDI